MPFISPWDEFALIPSRNPSRGITGGHVRYVIARAAAILPIGPRVVNGGVTSPGLGSRIR
ncbi:MAG: hypothetical protein AMXMBFR13_50200 [Phycisphaerae bacterium]